MHTHLHNCIRSSQHIFGALWEIRGLESHVTLKDTIAVIITSVFLWSNEGAMDRSPSLQLSTSVSRILVCFRLIISEAVCNAPYQLVYTAAVTNCLTHFISSNEVIHSGPAWENEYFISSMDCYSYGLLPFSPNSLAYKVILLPQHKRLSLFLRHLAQDKLYIFKYVVQIQNIVGFVGM